MSGVKMGQSNEDDMNVKELNLEEIEERFNKSTQKRWTGGMNYPFYGYVDKPSPSLSKHDSTQFHYWKPEDVEFVLWAHNHDVPEMIKEIKRLRNSLNKA